MSITHDQYRRARSISEPAARLLLDAIRPSQRGRKSLDPLIFLTGMQLAIDIYNVATITKIHTVLTRDLTLEDRLKLGSEKILPNGKSRAITQNDLYVLTRRISKMLDFSSRRAPLLSKCARHERRDHIDAIVAALLDTTLPIRPEGSHDYALDGTGIWAAERSRKKIPTAMPPDPEHEEESTTNDPLDSENQIPIGRSLTTPLHTPNPGKGNHGESDADIGAKTNKEGNREYFFGYDVEAVVRVPAISTCDVRVRTEPNLLERLVVIPAGTDIVSTCLRMFDRMAAQGIRIQSLLVDRHYNYKKYDRWLQELLNREIEQVADMHKNDQGFKDWDGVKMAAGWAHCPSTPDRLGKIPTLGPTASEEEVRVFNALINERRAYMAKRINPMSKDGKIRFGCPALDGAVGCPLRPGTMATATLLNLPIIMEPPAEVGRPSICTQKSVQLHVKTEAQKRATKTYQRFYWGSKQWRLSYARRTYVESWFGVLKNTTATGFHRGSHQFRGLPLVTIVLSMAAATTNLRLLRAWHEETGLGDPTHPLLQEDREFHGFKELTKEEARILYEIAKAEAALISVN
jgi:hypothetical protein